MSDERRPTFLFHESPYYKHKCEYDNDNNDEDAEDVPKQILHVSSLHFC